MSCFFKHTWSKWKVIEEGKIKFTDRPSGREYVAGTFIYQQRECEKCGKRELNKQIIEL